MPNTIGAAPFLILKFIGNPATPEAQLATATNTVANAGSETDKFYALDDAAKQSFIAGNVEDARRYALELLTLAPKYQDNWNYGNAIQDGKIVLGRIALQEGRTNEGEGAFARGRPKPGVTADE